MKYTIQDAIDAARLIEPELARRGLHASVGGSLMYRGDSEKDIDLIIYRHNPGDAPMAQPVSASVEAAALVAGFTVDHQRSGSGRRNREVLVTWWGEKRIDLIIA